MILTAYREMASAKYWQQQINSCACLTHKNGHAKNIWLHHQFPYRLVYPIAAQYANGSALVCAGVSQSACTARVGVRVGIHLLFAIDVLRSQASVLDITKLGINNTSTCLTQRTRCAPRPRAALSIHYLTDQHRPFSIPNSSGKRISQ